MCIKPPILIVPLLMAMFHGAVVEARSLSSKEQLGKSLFFDTSLSTPPGLACASCHGPEHFFTDPDTSIPTSKGARGELKGSRNAPTVLYALYSPPFHYDQAEGVYVGGQFWDGRASSLNIQAQGPFLNPLEMANPDKMSVVSKVRQSEYAPLFLKVYGRNALDRAARAFVNIADAITAFEQTAQFRPFTSKYDYYLMGKARFTEQERRGREVFEDEKKGNCAACHPDRPAEDGSLPLFTDFTYDNLGVPKNPENPFYRLTPQLNPKGFDAVDLGLGPIVGKKSENGKFKVSTLRNIAMTGPYTHNGYFKTLRGVIDFYNTRDTRPVCPNPLATEAEALKSGCWPKPETGETVNHDESGDLGLSEGDVDDLMAFLNTLTDGYVPEP